MSVLCYLFSTYWFFSQQCSIKRNVRRICNFLWLIFEVLIGNVSFSGEISQFARFVPKLGLDLMFSVLRMGEQELIYMLVMIGVLFFIFRFWSLTALLLCWQMRIHDSEPCYRHPNTKADERRRVSTLIWAMTQMQSCTYAQKHMSIHARANYSSLHPATVLRKLGCYVWQSLTFQTKDLDHILEDRRNLTSKQTFFDFQRAKEGLKTLMIALYISCRHTWRTSSSSEGNRWNSNCDKTSTSLGKKYEMIVFYKYILCLNLQFSGHIMEWSHVSRVCTYKYRCTQV